MEINSADLKPEEGGLAASDWELLRSAQKPADPIGNMGALTAILRKERRFKAVEFGMVCRFFWIRLL
jgi:hypothetical protein